MDTLAFDDSAFSLKQTGNGSKVQTMEKVEDDAGSSPPHSATGHPYLATSYVRNKLAYAPICRPPPPSRIPFPFKLHCMLDEVEERGIQNIVSWMPSGVAFKVHKPTEFIADVVPRYFNLTKYKSFKRQLLNYGFERLEEKGGARCDALGKMLYYDMRRLSSIKPQQIVEVFPIQSPRQMATNTHSVRHFYFNRPSVLSSPLQPR